MKTFPVFRGFPGGSDCKASARNVGDPGSIPGSGRSPEKEMATHSSILAWRIPWTEQPGRLQSTRSQRIGHDWVTSLLHFTFPVICRESLQTIVSVSQKRDCFQSFSSPLLGYWIWKGLISLITSPIRSSACLQTFLIQTVKIMFTM